MTELQSAEVFTINFLDKAKASLADIQGDLSRATASLGLGDKMDAPESSNATPIDTPATSVAPSTSGAPKAKLPLAFRKNSMQLLLSLCFYSVD